MEGSHYTQKILRLRRLRGCAQDDMYRIGVILSAAKDLFHPFFPDTLRYFVLTVLVLDQAE